MKKLIYKLSLCALIPFILGSAPAHDEKSLSPLVIEWDAQISFQLISLRNNIKDVSSVKTVTFPRKKYPSEVLHLIAIPKNKDYRPIKLQIPDNKNHIFLKTDQLVKTPENEIWLWGQTPSSRCGGHSSFHLRFLNKLKLYTNASGLFTWKLKRNDLPEKTAFYIEPRLKEDTPEDITSLALIKSNSRMFTQCLQHTGGTCPFVFDFKKDLSGRSFEIKFKKKLWPLDLFVNCPV
jgi:hypothetical protein